MIDSNIVMRLKVIISFLLRKDWPMSYKAVIVGLSSACFLLVVHRHYYL